MKPRPKRIRADSHGLLHGPLRIEIDEVTLRHRKSCSGCEQTPEGQRLRIVAGTARAAKTDIYCAACGGAWLRDHEVEVARAIRRLDGEDVCVRKVEGED